ncbi:phage minor capsid protein [Microbacterium sp. A1-JK]|uniref:phage minor capsid protein n=1 Tax=Microbacterium sp. A1-JK TaxID=3177516 RepID=UPI00388B41C9
MALFTPDPERSLEDIVEDLAREIADRYREAEDELIREVAIRAARDIELSGQMQGDTAAGGLTVEERRRQNRILAELSAHRARSLRELQAIAVAIASRLRSEDMAARMIYIAATEGEAAAAAYLGLAGRAETGVAQLPFIGGGAAVSTTTLTATASQAVGMVAVSLENRLENLAQRITRYPRDAYQRIVAMESPNTLLGVTTSRVQQARTVQRFLAEGIPGFTDRSGRRWTIGAYAEMAGRTSVARAYNDAGIYRMGLSGVNLGTIVGSLDACKRCAPWIGKIISLDGTTGEVVLPHATDDRSVTVQIHGTIDQARADGWGHPNCRDKVVAYLPGLTVPQADFQYDQKADEERQEQRRLEREVRSARRREVSAMNDTDRRRAASEVADAQRDLRSFTKDTGRSRQYYREQLGFADGR